MNPERLRAVQTPDSMMTSRPYLLVLICMLAVASGRVLYGQALGLGGTAALEQRIATLEAESAKSEAEQEELAQILYWGKPNGWQIIPFGQLRGETIYSQEEQIADAVVFFLAPGSPGVDTDQFTVHGKTSMLNFLINGPDLGSFKTGGMLLNNFLGQRPLRNQSGLNILNAYGEIKNDCWRFAFGRMFDLFGPISPTTVNGGGTRAAGNIGIFRGAVHVDRYFTISDVQKWTMSARLSQNTTNDFLLLPTARGKDNGFPNIEARLGLELGDETDGVRPLQIGVSGVWGEVQTFDPAQFLEDDEGNLGPIILPPINIVSTTAGGCIDFQLNGPRAGIRGEVWVGQAAGTYFVAILQTLNPVTGNGIRSIGGWIEGYYKLEECNTTVHVGYGLDDPRNQDVGSVTTSPNDPGQRLYNQVAWANMLWDVTDSFQLGVELSHRKTHYLNPLVSEDGMLVHFSSTLQF